MEAGKFLEEFVQHKYLKETRNGFKIVPLKQWGNKFFSQKLMGLFMHL